MGFLNILKYFQGPVYRDKKKSHASLDVTGLKSQGGEVEL